jgi:cytochrome bd-type quinol oxidase subunit 2
MTQVLDLVPIWTLILALAVFFYVLLDGFDLGVGMLYGFASDTRSRNSIMNSIAPIWDGNETWLVLGGLGLLAAFPTAFAVIIAAVYFPILVMLLALVFRGVAFEFRLRDSENRTFFTWPNALFLAPVPLATVLLGWFTWRALSSTAEATPFLGAMALFVVSYLGIAISLFPMIVPYHFTLWEAASSPRTQAFLLVGTLFLLPVILTYSGWSYWVFRGKVRTGSGY